MISGDLISAVVSVSLGLLTLAASTLGLMQALNKRLRRETGEESARLRSVIIGDEQPHVINVGGDLHLTDGAEGLDSRRNRAGDQRVDDDRFAELLIEYYAWGLTQARRSTALSLACSAVGVLVLMIGVGLAIWKAETTGDLYVSAVASAAGLVSTIIGQLAHRRADAAMAHMQRQTEDLRQDMKRERKTETAIRLTGEVEDPVLQAELQAALVLKLSGASLEEVRGIPAVKVPSQGEAATGAAV
ncbi:TRADD-N-associated membrane domain-containing protein [Streptomyces sp. JV184]|uniref:TRADD-N-associated membrane domain-containing protein n=1 Tax=Streptomyces sp. JV184 TaxID=858637 RepID=UPI002E767A98|nr:hypothetical protein [Streptomyces sp. JV184]MEE1750869.1 hypothetical protein [Streptomyces sp. JV184]